MAEKLLKNPEAIAEKLDVSIKTVKRWIKTEGLPAFQERDNGPYMCVESMLNQWLIEFSSRKMEETR